MKNWFVKNSDLIIDKIVPMIAIAALLAMVFIGFDPSDYVISAEWLVGTI